jgi:20S proteasome alpha/beta subunit
MLRRRPLKHDRLAARWNWRRKSVTIGIAGICKHRRKNAIVLCSDWQGTREGFTKSTDTYKMRAAGKATILISGEVGHADEFVSRLTPIFEEYDAKEKDKSGVDVRIVWLLDKIREIVQTYRSIRLDHAIRIKYGFSVEWYNNGGALQLRPERSAAVQTDIARFSIEELLIAYVDDLDPILIKITEDGDVTECDNYDCVGTGSTIALSFLCQEDWDERMSLMDCAARIYSAKVAAQQNPEVSVSTSFDIRVQGELPRDFTEEGFKYLRGRVRRFRFPRNLEFEESFLAEMPDE